MNQTEPHPYGKTIGLILGFCGICPIAFSYLLAGSASGQKEVMKWYAWLYTVILLFITAGFFRAAYLAYSRWSPLVIRHLVGAVFFPITLFCIYYLPQVVPTGWGVWFFLGTLPVCYITYRVLTFFWIRSAFPKAAQTKGSDGEGMPQRAG